MLKAKHHGTAQCKAVHKSPLGFPPVDIQLLQHRLLKLDTSFYEIQTV